MAYVPPHRRNSGAGKTPVSLPLPRRARRAVEDTTSGSFHTQSELRDCLGVDRLHTLTESPVNPDSLTAIIIYDGQHPNWPSEILCKTNLQILPDLNASDPLTASREYPLFAEVPFRNRGRGRVFEFDGWWKIAGIEYLEPQSQELVAILDRKFSQPPLKGRFGSDLQDQGKVRSAEAWKDSLSRRWAIITLEKNKARTDNPVRELAEATQSYLRLREEQLRVQCPSQMDTGSSQGESTSRSEEATAGPD